MVFDAEFAHARRQAVAIGLALMPHEVWMSRAEDDIDGVRTGFDDAGHRIDHRLDALARRQQAERQNDRLSSVAEFRLGVMRLQKREIRYSVRV